MVKQRTDRRAKEKQLDAAPMHEIAPEDELWAQKRARQAADIQAMKAIRGRSGHVVLRAELAPQGSASQILEALKMLQRDGELLRLGAGDYPARVGTNPRTR